MRNDLILYLTLAVLVIVFFVRRHLVSGKISFTTRPGAMPLDPSKMYEYTLVANFSDEKSAHSCAFDIASLNVPAKVTGLPNGRWNVDVTYVGKGDKERFAIVSDKLGKSAEKHGRFVGISAVGYA